MANKKLIYIKDPDMWEFISNMTNFSQWVRDKVKTEMVGGIDPVIASYIQQLIGNYMVEKRIGPVITTSPTATIDPDKCGFF